MPRAFLFDMDGTLINSIAAAERIWSAWATRHGLDAEAFVRTIHGARAVDTITKLQLPGIDPAAEAFGITQAEIIDVEGIVEIPGAAAFLKTLPKNQWAIVTSAPLALARRRLEAANIPSPLVIVTSEDVTQGKPNPSCYLLAAKKLGVPIKECVVFEDAAVGILAGEAAGADVVVVTATHHQKMNTAHSAISDYTGLIATTTGDGNLKLKFSR